MGNPLESLPRLDDAQLTNARRKEIASLDRKKIRERLGQFLIEGSRSLEAALDGEAVLTELFISGDAELGNDVLDRIRESKAPVFRLTGKLERQFADTVNPQGVLAVARIPSPDTGLLTVANRALLLDGVQDPGNVGTLIRTAAWFGVDAVCSLKGTADFFGPKVVRATMGGVWDVPLFRFDSMGDFGGYLGEDVPVWGADLSGTPVGEWMTGLRSVLAIGNEAHGLSDETAGALTGRVHIPAAHVPGAARKPRDPRASESLNAAVAGGILIAAWTGTVG